MSHHPIYRFTAIGRPLDPALPTNKAVLILLPIMLVLGLVWSLFESHPWQTAAAQGLVFALAAFGSWALGRELMPDDHAAAFISMAMALLACLSFDSPGLLMLYSTLLLVRIVNRSTGLMAMNRDSVLVTLLVIWTVYATQLPWMGAVAAVAFVFDATLRYPQRKQLLFAVMCLGTMIVYIVDHDFAWKSLHRPDSLLQWLGIAAALLFGLNLMVLKKVHSRGDVNGKRLIPERVKAGMAIALLAYLQGLGQMSQVILLVATVGGLCLGIAFRRSFRSTAKGLRHRE